MPASKKLDISKPATWFRFYAEFANDPKVQMLSEIDQRRYIMCLCLRCSNGVVTLHDEEVAFQLRINLDEWTKTKAVLLARGLIGEDNTPTAWEKRQFASDSSAERVARHRENKKRACNVTETKCNAPETETEKRREEKNNDVSDLAKSEAQKTESSSSLPRSHEQVRCSEIAVLLRQRGASLTHADPRVIDWAKTGVTDTQLLQALDTAKAQREEKNDPSAINAGYLDSILNSQKRKARTNARGHDRPLTQAEKRSQVAQFQFRNLPENRNASESNIIDITPAIES
jgi:hypothetical protein